MRLAVLALFVALVGAGCGEDRAGDEPVHAARFPDVVAAEAQQAADGSWTFAVTISSPYDTAQRYADAWRVVSQDGEVLGVRELTHDHAGEQPFTRSLPGVVIGEDVSEVTVEARDLSYGWGGATVSVVLRPA